MQVLIQAIGIAGSLYIWSGDRYFVPKRSHRLNALYVYVFLTKMMKNIKFNKFLFGPGAVLSILLVSTYQPRTKKELI